MVKKHLPQLTRTLFHKYPNSRTGPLPPPRHALPSPSLHLTISLICFTGDRASWEKGSLSKDKSKKNPRLLIMVKDLSSLLHSMILLIPLGTTYRQKISKSQILAIQKDMKQCHFIATNLCLHWKKLEDTMDTIGDTISVMNYILKICHLFSPWYKRYCACWMMLLLGRIKISGFLWTRGLIASKIDKDDKFMMKGDVLKEKLYTHTIDKFPS
uniref:Uncharacterized protein n=1 Tax=Romanomermis culicivorax TaxID=13658 RepID=A0A915IWB8_ROMCU